MKPIINGVKLDGIGEIHAARESLEQFPQEIEAELWDKLVELSNFWHSRDANFLRLRATPALEIHEPDAEKVLIALAGVSLYSANAILIEYAKTMINEYERTVS